MKLKRNLELYVLTALLTLSLGLAIFGAAGAKQGPGKASPRPSFSSRATWKS